MHISRKQYDALIAKSQTPSENRDTALGMLLRDLQKFQQTQGILSDWMDNPITVQSDLHCKPANQENNVFDAAIAAEMALEKFTSALREYAMFNIDKMTKIAGSK